jgi:hypothetical protein
VSDIPLQFDDAVRKFDAFLLEQGYTGHILWVFAEDLTSRRTDTWVRWPIAKENLSKVHDLYDLLKTGSGLRLEAQCRVGEFICCTISGPKSDDAATGRFISGLTLCVAQPLREALAVLSRLEWKRLLRQNGTPPTSGTAAFIHADT